jgi:hypothetical protein
MRFNITMSLDGSIAGPNQSVENPLGEEREPIQAIAGPGVTHLKYRVLE